MKNKKLTIYILVYNNSDGLEYTINSVMEQDIADAEIIISDDGSTNYNLTLLDEYADRLRSKYSRVIVNVNEKNLGTVKHLNKVFSMATGDVLITCSSGDAFANKESVASIVDAFDKTDNLIITSRRIDRYPDHDKKRPSQLLGLLLAFWPKKLMNYMIRKKNLISGCSTFYRKEIFDKYGILDERYHLVEDYPYYINLLRKGVKIGFLNKAVIVHTMGGVSTGKIHPSIYNDINLMRKDLLECQNEFDKATREFLNSCGKNN